MSIDYNPILKYRFAIALIIKRGNHQRAVRKVSVYLQCGDRYIYLMGAKTQVLGLHKKTPKGQSPSGVESGCIYHFLLPGDRPPIRRVLNKFDD